MVLVEAVKRRVARLGTSGRRQTGLGAYVTVTRVRIPGPGQADVELMVRTGPVSIRLLDFRLRAMIGLRREAIGPNRVLLFDEFDAHPRASRSR
jgi:hypothetical protein